MINPNSNNGKNLLHDDEEVLDLEELSSSDTSDDADSSTSSSNSSDDMKTKMRKMLLIVVFCVIVLIIILLFSSLIFPKNRSYAEIESIMKKAAVKYYDANKGLLPKNGNMVEVNVQRLSNSGYMQDISKYGASSCTGKVVVYNNDDTFVYTPYLDCGKKYTTVELFRKVTNSKNIVMSGNGLYYNNGEYVFKGDEVNNYVQIDKNIWRIVKVNNKSEVVLVFDGGVGVTYPWDDRYNNDKSYKAGINNYDVSRIKTRLKDIFKSNKPTNDYEMNVGILSKDSRGIAINYDLCVGHRLKNTTVKDNSIECSSTVSTNIGLLTVSDYINASLDTSCTVFTNRSCQNYNYLVNKEIKGFWLATAAGEDSAGVYFVTQSGYIDVTDASNYKEIRPVIHLNSKTMYKSGKGTKEKPYILKY